MKSFQITDPRLDHRKPGEFVITSQPEFSWQMRSARHGAAQSAYRIVTRSSDGEVIWDSGKVADSYSAAIPWHGRELRSREKGTWTLEVWDDAGRKEATLPIPFEVTLLDNSDWKAQWISFDGNNPSVSAPCPYFRKKFTLEEKPVQARLYITARGLFEAYINGKKAGEDRFVPGWSNFNKHIQFLTYDVTGLCQAGDNLLGAILGEGWYCGCGRRKNFYGDRPELLAQLELTFADGSVKKVLSGRNWKCTTGPFLYSDIYDGEFYDARLEIPGWDMPAFDDRKWRAATVGESAVKSPRLLPKRGEPVREIMTLKPVDILHPRQDVWIWDFGQNISGYLRIKIGGSRGRLYTLRFGEMLYDDNTLYNLNYRGARSTDFVVMGNEPVMDYEPKFTFHGFRYAQIDGFQFSNTDFSVKDMEVEAVVLYSCLEENGIFECGNEKLNRLYQNTLWSQRDNFFELPTDCPQRDERLGWTGDAQVFAGAACCSMNTLNFFRKYMHDVRDTQRNDGAIASIAPDILGYSFGAAGWADAITIIPWVMYCRYGSTEILKENFAAMEKWVNFQKNSSNGLIRPKTFYGDHLNFSPVETPSELLGTAYFYNSASLLSKIAAILGKKQKSVIYSELAQQVYEAYRAKYVDKDGMVNIHSQTALAISLHFGLIPDADRRKNRDLLVKLISGNGNRLTTGFLGTACLNTALSANGATATALDLYLQEAFPSWLFPVNQGATTIWERWNSYTLKDGFGNVNMNSFNHYAYGAVHEWVVDTVCGIRLTSPGGKNIRFSCTPDKRIGHAKAEIGTSYGQVSSQWKFTPDGNVIWEISAPANTVIEIVIPDKWQCSAESLPTGCGKYKLELQPT
ncbi:MAG: family 78 glycoside hydrolase catalytic domain [Lentisphaeria bacterium]|nr:family 78 glycoside hydrolase catalytic domain [Lentisphaeria bacterium]